MNLPKCIEKIIDTTNKKMECSYSDHVDYIDDYFGHSDDSDVYQDDST